MAWGDEELKIWDVFERIRITKKNICGLHDEGGRTDMSEVYLFARRRGLGRSERRGFLQPPEFVGGRYLALTENPKGRYVPKVGTWQPRTMPLGTDRRSVNSAYLQNQVLNFVSTYSLAPWDFRLRKRGPSR